MNMVSKSDGKRALTVWLSFNWLLLLPFFLLYCWYCIVNAAVVMMMVVGRKALGFTPYDRYECSVVSGDFLLPFASSSLIYSFLLLCNCSISPLGRCGCVCVCCVFVRFNYILVPSPSYKVYIIKTSRWRMGIWLVFPSLTPNGVQFEK